MQIQCTNASEESQIESIDPRVRPQGSFSPPRRVDSEKMSGMFNSVVKMKRN